MTPKFIHVKDAVRIYGACRSIIYQLLSDGKIKAVKLGKSTLLDVASLDQFFSRLPAAKIGG